MKALAVARWTSPPPSPSSRTWRWRRATARAGELAREAWDLIQGSPQGDSWATANAKVRIARCFLQQGLLAEAETLLLTARQVLAAQLGEGHSDTREARAQLVALYTAWGKPQQAAAFAPAG